MTEYSYDIGGKVYRQGPLVLAQVRQLIAEIGSLGINPAAGTAELVKSLLCCSQLERALAVVLTPDGSSLRDKDIDSLAVELAFDITAEQIAQVVADFFICNPIASLLEKLSGIMGGMLPQQIPPAMPLTGSTTLSAFSPTETSPGETQCCGDSPPQNVNHS